MWIASAVDKPKRRRVPTPKPSILSHIFKCGPILIPSDRRIIPADVLILVFAETGITETGIRTPLIVHWPAGLKSKAGSITREVGHVFDIMPTCLDLAGAKPLTQIKGNKTYPMNGKSLAPVFKNKNRAPHSVMYWDHAQGAAIRKDGWKLVRAGRRKAQWELYRINEDRVELKDLASKHPDKVEALAAEWTAWRPHTRALK